MTGYTRQSVADIVNGENITAPPINAEFNKLQDAFGTTGHSHDGAAGNAPKIDLASSISGFLPQAHGGIGGKNNVNATIDPTNLDDTASGYTAGSMWINLTTKRIHVCVDATQSSAVWYELGAITNGNTFVPKADNTVDIGSTSLRFKDLFFAGNVNSTNVAATAVTADTVTATPTGNNHTIFGNLLGNATGNFKGDIYAVDDTLVLDNGTDGTDAAFTGSVTGNVTGDVTGNLTGNVTGDVTGNVTGNSTGTHTGPVDANTNIITNVTDPVNDQDAATKKYVNDQLSLGTNSVDQFRQDAQKFAINPEDQIFTTSNNVTGYSALHYAAKANASSVAALASQNAAADSETSAASSATTASNKAALLSNFVDGNEQRLIGVLI